MAFGLTSAGFVKKRLSDCKSELEAAFRAAFGNSINLQPGSVFATIIGIQAERESSVWELAEEVYNSAYPDTSTGVSLDNVASITATKRNPAQKSTIEQVQLTGTPSTIVPVGTVLAVSGNALAQFVTDIDATIGGGGTVVVSATAVTAGPTVAPTGTLTSIVTPVFGLASVTNLVDASVGRNIETDNELKIRRKDELAKEGTGTLEALRTRIKELANVTEAIVFENTDDTTDGSGQPPHSFQCFVDGGADQDIADCIWQNKPAGIKPYGDVTKSINDSQGIAHIMAFSRPIEKPVYVSVTITKDSTYPTDGDTQIKSLIAAYGSTLKIGDDVLVYPKLLPSFAGLVNGILTISIKVGFSASPTTDANLTVGPNERATFDTARITVVSS